MSTSGEAPDVISLGLEAVNMAVSNDLLLPLDDIIAGDEELTAKKINMHRLCLMDLVLVIHYTACRTELRQW